MPRMLSFTRYEKELVPAYRNSLNHAKTREEVNRAFERTVGRLFAKAFGDETVPGPGVFALAPRESLGFTFREDFLRRDEVNAAWEGSDLPHVLGRLAEAGVGRLAGVDQGNAKSQARPR